MDIKAKLLEYVVLLSNQTSLEGDRNHNILLTSFPVVSSNAASKTSTF